MIELSFPWPPRELSPNARVHWSKKAKAAKKYKEDCYWSCKSVIPKAERIAIIYNYTSIQLSITFCPPDNRRRDADNCLGLFKYGIDAISDFTGIDDSKFTIQFCKAEPVKFGAVKVVIA